MSTLSEFASKEILARHGLPILQERVVSSSAEVAEVLAQMSLPVVAKLCGPSIAHKTERGLVKLNLQTNDDVSKAVDDLLAAAVPADGEVEVLIAPMVKSSREFIAGVVRDAQFGPNVMLGVGGVLAEAIADVVFRPVPLSSHDAHEMVAELRSQKLLDEFRGEPAVSVDALVSVLLALSNVSVERSDIASIDLNPLLVTSTGEVVAVDALVEIEDAFTTPTNQTIASSVLDDEHFRALFEPKGVVVTGASSHPGKFGFVSVHNILASGYSGAVFGTNLSEEEVLGIQTVASLDDIPKDAADLVFVCTPSGANPEILRACARRGIKAAFLTSAGYGEAGDEGIRLEQELIALANELGILLAGPNGQGVVSTPTQLCAQIVAPYPPRGRIGVASQSGNFVSSFLNYSRQSGVGVSRAVSAGNAACVS
ncbi:acetate--CoA ligase family protein, partial [bacterium]|nr:acetate--CoA ligase family protein [bacterium]